MKNYFELSPSAKPEISGAYPQVVLSDYKQLHFFDSLDRARPFPEHENFEKFKFAEGAKATDFVTCGVLGTDKGMIISQRFHDTIVTLVQDGLVTSATHSISMNIDGKAYFLVQLLNGGELIDWKNSLFEDLLQDEETAVSLAKEEYTPMRYGPKLIKLSFDCDLFQLPFSSRVIISEQLKTKIESLYLTGIDPILPFRWFQVK